MISERNEFIRRDASKGKGLKKGPLRSQHHNVRGADAVDRRDPNLVKIGAQFSKKYLSSLKSGFCAGYFFGPLPLAQGNGLARHVLESDVSGAIIDLIGVGLAIAAGRKCVEGCRTPALRQTVIIEAVGEEGP